MNLLGKCKGEYNIIYLLNFFFLKERLNPTKRPINEKGGHKAENDTGTETRLL